MKETMNKEIDLVNDEFIVNCIDNTKEERQLVYKFLVDNRNYDKLYLRNNHNVIICNKEGGDSNYNSLENAKEVYPEYKVYTFNEFKQKYLNINKEIIAYKLIKPEFRKAVNSILDKIGNILRQDGITEDYNTHNLLKEAGVLDLWFEPVYKKEKPKEIIYNMGSFELKITKEGIFHKIENIIVFVENLCDFYSNLPSKFSGHYCTVDEITFKKTGCEQNITKANDWFKVYEQYKNLQ
jgi:hypothetical protein